MGFSISGVLGHCEPARCFTESLAFLTVVTKTIKSVFPFCCCSQYDGSILTIPANKLFNHVYCSPMFPTASQGSQLPRTFNPWHALGLGNACVRAWWFNYCCYRLWPRNCSSKNGNEMCVCFSCFYYFSLHIVQLFIVSRFFLERHTVWRQTIVADLRGAGARMRKSDLDYPSGS